MISKKSGLQRGDNSEVAYSEGITVRWLTARCLQRGGLQRGDNSEVEDPSGHTILHPENLEP